jgi:hypothetical protein
MEYSEDLRAQLMEEMRAIEDKAVQCETGGEALALAKKEIRMLCEKYGVASQDWSQDWPMEFRDLFSKAKPIAWKP